MTMCYVNGVAPSEKSIENNYLTLQFQSALASCLFSALSLMQEFSDSYLNFLLPFFLFSYSDTAFVESDMAGSCHVRFNKRFLIQESQKCVNDQQKHNECQ